MLPPIRELSVDCRQRSFVLPQRVVLTRGNASNAEALLQERTLQIHISDADTLLLDNRGSDTPAGVLLDYGRELSGGIRLLCAATKDNMYARVRIRFGESASEAMTPLFTKGACNDHAVRDLVVPVPAMSDQEWGQTGFRFVYIELEEPDAFITLKSVPAVFVRRDIPQLGTFRSSDPLLEQIFDTAAYTCQLCMQHLLWDGVKRDRLVWIGDSHPEMLTIRTAFGYQPMLEDSLDDILQETPLPGWMNGFPAYSMWWLRILRDWYFYTGNAAYPQKHAAYIQGLVDQTLSLIGEQGAIGFPQFFLDWPSCGTPAAVDGVQALTIWALEGAIDLLALFDDTERIARVRDGLCQLRKYDADSRDSKQATALLYTVGLLDADTTAAILRKDGAKGVSTFMSYYILSALADTGHTAEALQILRDYYGGMLQMGATTFWEDFSLDWAENACPIDRLPRDGEKDIHGDFGNFCYLQFRHSLCHGWSSGPVPFLLERVLGIHFDVPGGSTIRLTPALGDLEWAEGTYPLPDGQVLWVRCERTADGIHTQWKAPEGVTVITE